MPKFELTFTVDNAAFEFVEAETLRILRDVASKIERGSRSGLVIDINGNTIGSYLLERPLT